MLLGVFLSSNIEVVPRGWKGKKGHCYQNDKQRLQKKLTILTIVLITCKSHVKVRVDLTGACTWQCVPEHVRYGVFSVPVMRSFKPEGGNAKTTPEICVLHVPCKPAFHKCREYTSYEKLYHAQGCLHTSHLKSTIFTDVHPTGWQTSANFAIFSERNIFVLILPLFPHVFLLH